MLMLNVTLKQLRYFSALAKYRHFAQAASACAITQPAMSMQLRELEETLRCILIEKGTRPVRLTEIGQRVLDRAGVILGEVENIEELPELIKKSLKIKVEISDLDKFLQLYENNTLSFDMIEFVNRFNHEFYYDAGLFDVNIDEIKLNNFLTKQEDFFSDLISGYIKKINH